MIYVYDVHRTVCMYAKYGNLDLLFKELGDNEMKNSKNLLKYLIYLLYFKFMSIIFLIVY